MQTPKIAPPDFSGLTLEQASFLEQCLSQAAIRFHHKADSYRKEGHHEMVRLFFAKRDEALFWQKAALVREHRARIEEARAA